MRASGKFAKWADQGSRGVAITGASGWVGRAIAHAVARVLPRARNLELRLFGSVERPIEVAGTPFPLEALGTARPLDHRRQWLVVHLAVAGGEREADPVRRRTLNDGFLQAAFRLAESAEVRRFVPASSGAVHQAGSAESESYVDLKRRHEDAARAWAARTSTPLLIPRIFNLGGPYMNHARRYALGNFIHQARDTGRIRIEATKPVIRSYAHVLEFAEVALELALKEDDEILFDTAGTEAVEMADLARAVARALELDLEIMRPPMTGANEDHYVGDGGVYRSALAAIGVAPIDLDQIIRDTDAWIVQGRVPA